MLSYIAGAVVLQPLNRFDHVIREAIRNLECSGNETLYLSATLILRRLKIVDT